MAKRNKNKYQDTFEKASRNRGEEFNEPKTNYNYDYMPQDQYTDKAQERAIKRYEARNVYEDMYENNQQRDQRAFERVKNMENEFYAGVDPRRKIELGEGGMVREDRNAMANLPRQAIHCEYPQAPFYEKQYLDATVRGELDILDDDGSSKRRFQNPYRAFQHPYE